MEQIANAGANPPLPRTAGDVQTVSNNVLDMNHVPIDEPLDPLDAMIEPLAGEPSVQDVTQEPSPEPKPVVSDPSDFSDFLAANRHLISDTAYQTYKNQIEDMRRRANAFDFTSAALSQPAQDTQVRMPPPPQPPKIDREAIDKALAAGMPVGEIVTQIADAKSQYAAELAQYNFNKKLAEVEKNQSTQLESRIQAFKSDIDLERFKESHSDVFENQDMLAMMVGRVAQMQSLPESQNMTPAEILKKAYKSIPEALKQPKTAPVNTPSARPQDNVRNLAANSVASGNRAPVTTSRQKPIETMEDAVSMAMKTLTQGMRR
jgi:hypothetical protein